MNRLEKILSGWNFKKIAIVYLVLAVIAGIACAGTVGYIYRERLDFAWQYSRLEEAEDDAALKAAAQKTADASSDVVDVLILDGSGKVAYSAKNSEFGAGQLELLPAGSDRKYLVSAQYPDAAFHYVKGEEFMLKSIINKDFGQIREDYDYDSVFESSLSSRKIYMLSLVKAESGEGSVYVITVPTSVPGGMTALKTTAALAMLFFCAYWVLVALWIYRDAAKSRLSPLYWGLVGLLTNIVGLIVYKIYKRGMAVCPACKAAQNPGHLYCSFCGAQLGERCENCGHKVGEKDSFCHYCGNKLK